MPRRVQDIIPNKNRSIRDIPVERNAVTAPIQPPMERKVVKTRVPTDDMRQPEKKEVPRVSEAESTEPPVTKVTKNKKPGSSKKWPYFLMGIVIVVAGAAYAASVFFSHASFTIVPKSIPVAVNSTYISQNTAGAPTNNLSYELATVKSTMSSTVTAVDGPKISTSAKGKITLYNSSGPTAQRLIAGTRLSDDTGRIYRLTNSVVVPGQTTTSSKTTPGSIIVLVTAAEAGQSYNISKTDSISDFKIVAYKGSAKYDTIYGRIATDITGGFLGTQKTISPVVLASTTADLKSKITASLLAQVKASIPPGYIMYPTAYVAVFSKPTTGGTDAKTATITMDGTLHGILFKKDDLVLRIAGEQTIATFDSFPFETQGLESLEFSIANLKDFSPEKKNTLISKLRGNLVMIGSVPVDEIKKKLAGLSLSETEAVFRSYKPVIEIEESSGEITPPWSKVPSNPDRISVKLLTK